MLFSFLSCVWNFSFLLCAIFLFCRICWIFPVDHLYAWDSANTIVFCDPIYFMCFLMNITSNRLLYKGFDTNSLLIVCSFCIHTYVEPCYKYAMYVHYKMRRYLPWKLLIWESSLFCFNHCSTCSQFHFNGSI